MLIELVVEDFGVIERAELNLDRGSSALTGETGAGKTLLIAAVGLLLGARGDRSSVRSGASEARVEGRFLIPVDHPAATGLVEAGLLDMGPPGDEVEAVLCRVISVDGKSKARINGRLVPLALLSELGGLLVEIAGQHEHQRLTSATEQRGLLDAFAGPPAVDLAARTRLQFGRVSDLARKLDTLRADERARARELDVLEHEVKEIRSAALEPGEAASLAEEASRLENAEELAEGLTAVDRALTGEEGAAELISSARHQLTSLAPLDPKLVVAAERLTSLEIELTDTASDVAGRVAEADPIALERIHQRIGVLARLRRKYGDDETSILDYLERAVERKAELETADDDLVRLASELESAMAEVKSTAAQLSATRRAAASELEKSVGVLLDELALGEARFVVNVHDHELDENGVDGVEFLVGLNPGEIPRPIGKVASGGELSRLSLALHLLTSTGVARTMIFDEVDAGVGGETAHSVGRALSNLARRGVPQVLMVTHLPQVAAFADRHYKVSKQEQAGRRSSQVHEVRGSDRVEELSRMLAGLPESERAREHAQELLEMAARAVARA